MSIQHRNIPDSQLHEVKGAAAATSGQILVADGSGSAGFQSFDSYCGVWYYADDATDSSPIAITLADTYYTLTNDGLGTNTNTTYGLTDIPDIWDDSTSSFDFSDLDLGDSVDIRLEVEVNTSGTNHEIKVDLELASGTGSPIYIPFVNTIVKTSTSSIMSRFNGIFIGDANVRDNPAKLLIKSDSTGDTVTVRSWYVRVIKRSLG